MVDIERPKHVEFLEYKPRYSGISLYTYTYCTEMVGVRVHYLSTGGAAMLERTVPT
jgi:hypothetical protein